MRYFTEADRPMQRLYVLREFLDAPLCREIIAEIQRGGMSPATVSNPAGKITVDERHRRTLDVWVPNAVQAAVADRLASLKSELEVHFAVNLPEFRRPQFLCYRRGDFFRPHQDSTANPGHAPTVRFRKISTVLFLNHQARLPEPHAYCGGELALFRVDDHPDPVLWINGCAGLLVAFASDVFHEVRPVTHGERFTVVTWFLDRIL